MANKNAERLLKKFNRYRKLSFSAEVEPEWLEEIGFVFYRYIEHCAKHGNAVTMKEFEWKLDAAFKELECE
jgi:hypothetical protein